MKTGDAKSPAHGVDAWKLADYEWSAVTGEGRFVYRRNDEMQIVSRCQTKYWTPGAILDEEQYAP